jgi:hypothetical protein
MATKNSEQSWIALFNRGFEADVIQRLDFPCIEGTTVTFGTLKKFQKIYLSEETINGTNLQAASALINGG